MTDFEPRITAFVCNWCTYTGADLAGTSRLQMEPNVRVVRLPCTGRIDPLFVIKAFEHGADGVIVSGCHPGDCHYTSGNYHARRRFAVAEGHHLVGVGREAFERGLLRLQRQVVRDGEPETERRRIGVDAHQAVGLGVWQAGRGRPTREAVLAALRSGYRHVDTARIYGNEADVGEASAQLSAVLWL